MIDVVKLAEFIEVKLNDNSQNLTFRTFTFEKTLDRRYTSDGTTKTQFIPSIITTPIGSYLPMNTMRGSRLSFNLEILLPLSDKYQWIEMVNEFIWSINGRLFYLDESSITSTKPEETSAVTLKVTCQVPSFGSVTAQNFELMNEISTYLPIKKTENYVGINIPISIKTIENFAVGDEIQIYLSEIPLGADNWVASTSVEYNAAPEAQRIQITSPTFDMVKDMIIWLKTNHPTGIPYRYAKGTNSAGTVFHYAKFLTSETAIYTRIIAPDFTVKRTKLPKTEHFEGENTGETFIAENDVKYICTAYYENTLLHNKLIENMVEGKNQNQTYWLKVIYPNAYTFTLKVVILDEASVFPIDDYALIPLVLTKAWTE